MLPISNVEAGSATTPVFTSWKRLPETRVLEVSPLTWIPMSP